MFLSMVGKGLCVHLGEHADNIGVQCVLLLKLSVGSDGMGLSQGAFPLPASLRFQKLVTVLQFRQYVHIYDKPVSVVNHPEAVITVMCGKLAKIAPLHPK